jgi:hypothetical protein
MDRRIACSLYSRPRCLHHPRVRRIAVGPQRAEEIGGSELRVGDEH